MVDDKEVSVFMWSLLSAWQPVKDNQLTGIQS